MRIFCAVFFIFINGLLLGCSAAPDVPPPASDPISMDAPVLKENGPDLRAKPSPAPDPSR